MPAADVDPSARSDQTALAAVAIGHAVLVLCVWGGMIYFDLSIISAGAWLALFWSWLIWPVAFLAKSRRSLRGGLAPCVVGVVLLVPCLSTAWTFTLWAIEGFAP